jgi:hypothetical protein
MTIYDELALPIYAEKARILNGRDLYRRAGISYDAISEIAHCHTNTVRDAINGKSKQYQKAHDVFSALNSLLRNSYNREEHVQFLNDAGEFQADPALSKTLVFLRLREIIQANKIKTVALSEKSKVNLLVVEESLKRKPIDHRIQEDLFNTLLGMGLSLNIGDELIK